MLRPEQPIKIAILAMGGQGGGVLADWIVELAEHAGWWAQTSSVPGVAQRTGATIYYLELMPESVIAAAGRPPALALMPTPGDVDLVAAAELMEAGRAMQRGLVTPDRTTLVTSSHRAYAVAEKAALGNGIADPNQVLDAGRAASRRFFCLDLQQMAEQAGSVISASLFGAIAASGVLPFERAEFEATITRGGVGAKASLAAFAAAYAATLAAPVEPAPIDQSRPEPIVPERADDPGVQALLDRLKRELPAAIASITVAGLRRLVDFQDVRYADDYLRRLVALYAVDRANGGERRGWALCLAGARYLAVAMSYDDVIRVADLKTRGSRFQRVRDEVLAQPDQLVYTTEFMHPRLEEVCGTLPAALGRWLEGSPRLSAVLRRRIDKGRRVRSGTLVWFVGLYLVAGMRRFRRSTLRHQQEMTVIQAWLDQVTRLAPVDYALATELLICRRLVKGYSGTHDRGDSRFARLTQAADRLAGRSDAAALLRQLREAAMADEQGKQLEQNWRQVFDAVPAAA